MIEIFILLTVLSISCSLLGTTLVIKNESMIADALSHSVLLGIVIGFFITNQLNSPLLIFGATLFGILTVLFIEQLLTSNRINHDSATGLVFPLLFSLAVILISMFARNIHLDLDMVLMGEILFSSFERITLFQMSFSTSLLKNGILLFVNCLFILTGYHYLKLHLCDSTFATLSGVKNHRLKLIILTLTALTTVTAFDAVGSITVISFFVAPAMTSLYWSHSFKQLLYLTTLASILLSFIGFLLANLLDLSISGTTSFVALILFLISQSLAIVHKKYFASSQTN